MPELPDVAGFRGYVESRCLGRRVGRTLVSGERALRGITPAVLGRRVKGRRFTATERHGKFLFAALSDDGGWVVLHFRHDGRADADRPGRRDAQAHAG